MAIVIIDGAEKSGKTFLANALRNNHIGGKKGVLLLDEAKSGGLMAMVGKVFGTKPKAPDSDNRGALLIDEATEGDLKALLEKILVGVPMPDVILADWATALPWKPDSMIIFVGYRQEMLDRFESLLPGFRRRFGPVYRIGMEVGP